jgi:hypothetical protein
MLHLAITGKPTVALRDFSLHRAAKEYRLASVYFA